MASEQDINRAKELASIEEQRLKTKQKLNSLDADAVSLASSLVDSIKEIQGISTRRSTFDQQLLKVNKQISSEILGQKSGLTDISSIQKQIAKNDALIEKSKKLSNSLSSSILGNEKKRVDLAIKRAKEISAENSIQKELLTAAEAGREFDREKYNISVETQANHERSLENLTKQLGPMAQQAVFSAQILSSLEEQNKEREKEKEKVERINELLGITGAVLKGAEGFMNKIGLGALSSAMGFGTINKELEKYTASLEEGENGMDDTQKKQLVMAKSFKLMGEAAKKD